MHLLQLVLLYTVSYRFAKDDTIRLAAALSLPEAYHCVQGTRATGMEALMGMLPTPWPVHYVTLSPYLAVLSLN